MGQLINILPNIYLFVVFVDVCGKLSFHRKSRRTKSMVANSFSYIVKCLLVQVKHSIATTENGTVGDISQTYDDVFKLFVPFAMNECIIQFIVRQPKTTYWPIWAFCISYLLLIKYTSRIASSHFASVVCTRSTSLYHGKICHRFGSGSPLDCIRRIKYLCRKGEPSASKKTDSSKIYALI